MREEGHAAILDYRIMRNGQEVFASSGRGIRNHRGGRRISNNPVIYTFRKGQSRA